MTPEEFRVAGHQLIDWIADYRTRVPDLPVQAQVKPGEVTDALPSTPPADPVGIDSLLKDLDEIIVPGLMMVQHPRHTGWFPSNASLASVLGDITSSGIGALGISWQSAPALTELEGVVCDWMRQLTGLSEGWKGVIQDTASTGCLVALLAARERAADYVSERGGMQSLPAPLTVYASEHAHSAIPKAALLAGFGRDNIRSIPTGSSFALDTASLRAAIEKDVDEGRLPAAIVVSLGTTATTAFDPLAEIMEIAAAHGIWVHIDAAMAGSALLLPEYRWMIEGIDGFTTPSGVTVPPADSLGWNPHKWMGTILDTSLLYVREPDRLVRVMSTNPSFLRNSVSGERVATEYRDWGIPLGRRFRALKLWFHLRLDGVAAIQDRLRRDLANARRLAALVAAEPGWTVVAPVQLQTVCVRHEPVVKRGTEDAGGRPLSGEALDAHTLAWADALNRSGVGTVTPAVVGGRWTVRISIGVETTEWPDVEAVWTAAKNLAGRDIAVQSQVTTATVGDSGASGA
ncbi:pyridoxal-dependent decarboxylase [Kineosporia sp. NBRC 101731]|uniref:pyridoxal phosphate-dependent decarboxylase family protein n=1 Tax=Kineosporia sp. NBRC 101731 TaxID=3032199 RepID=UPI0024A2CEC2|nr:pyridoxal-dependent decarboxylase [Kineosporia sp. NBRC 101731]GLY32768.1 aromatic-L-amino-acid decarboxylase [Kineosporia sp. NBRC 101731]